MENFKKSFLGYTLIEILVGLTIVGMVFGVGFASFRSFARRQSVTSTIRALKADLRLAQEQALAGKKPDSPNCNSPNYLDGYNFIVDSSSQYTIEARCTGGTVTVKQVNLDNVTISIPFPNPILFKVLGQGTNIAATSQASIVVEEIQTGFALAIAVLPGGDVSDIAVPSPTPIPTPTSISTPTPTPQPTATPTPTSGAGVITHAGTVVGTAIGNPSSVSTSGSVTASSGVYLAVVVSKSNTSVSSVSGLGVSWTEIANQCSGRNAQGLSVWKPNSTPSSSGVVTATFSSSPSEAAISVSRYSGATTTGNIAKANTNGVNGACSGGTDSTSPAVNLTTTSANSFAFGAVAKRNRTFTPGSGFAERADFDSGGGGSAAGIAIEDKGISSPSTFSVYGTTSGTTDWAIVAVEIK